ncbi:MAG: hypothetical protein JW874_03520 [Spirochaetales bacterium]|nr:hypothetical protein [Spirochaetales bacterium]
MTEKKLDLTMQQTLLRYEKVLQVIDADLADDDFSQYEELLKQAVSLSAMIGSCVKVKRALQVEQRNKKEDEKYVFPDNTISSIQVRIGNLKTHIKGKMKENLEQQRRILPGLKIASPFSGKPGPVLIDITS